MLVSWTWTDDKHWSTSDPLHYVVQWTTVPGAQMKWQRVSKDQNNTLITGTQYITHGDKTKPGIAWSHTKKTWHQMFGNVFSWEEAASSCGQLEDYICLKLLIQMSLHAWAKLMFVDCLEHSVLMVREFISPVLFQAWEQVCGTTSLCTLWPAEESALHHPGWSTPKNRVRVIALCFTYKQKKAPLLSLDDKKVCVNKYLQICNNIL